MEHGRYHHVYVSPHFDDAIFSCGGTIARQVARDERALVVTVCTGRASSDVASSDGARAASHARGDAPLAVFENLQRRRSEDQQAMNLLGVDWRWLGEDDAIVRDRRYRSLPRATGRPFRRDAAVVRRLVDALSELPLADGARIYLPLAVGNHVDHQLTFAAGVVLAIDAAFCHDVLFYEDIPYALIPHALPQRLSRLARPWAARIRTPRTLRSRVVESTAALRQLPLIARELTPTTRLALPLYILAVQLQLIPLLRVDLPGEATFVPYLQDVSTERPTLLGAIGCYQSQVSAIMGSMDRMALALKRHAAAILPGASAAERFWRLELDGRQTASRSLTPLLRPRSRTRRGP